MKRLEFLFTFLQLPVDFFLIVAAGGSAYALRYTEFMKGIRPIMFDLPWDKYWPIVLLTAAAWVVIFAFAGLYHTNPNRKLLRDLERVILACSTGFAGITIYVFFTLQKFDSRFLVLAGWALAILYVCAGRILLRGLKLWLHKLGVGLRRTVVIGSQTVAENIVNYLRAKQYLGYTVAGVFPHFDDAVAANLKDIRPDEIIFADPKADEVGALSAIDFALAHHITFKYSADLFATISTNMTVSTVAGVPIIELGRTRLSGWNTILKRLFDIVGALLLIVLFSPLYLLVALGIAIDSGFPIFYKNERVGQAGKNFFAYKFRSMFKKDCTGAQYGQTGAAALVHEQELIAKQSVKTGPVYKIKNDPRVTRFGRFIRRFSLDEIPQFVNVLKGEMSLVGPRPHQPREVAKYQTRHKAVLAIKPGVTGMAQISGRSDLSFEDEVRLDTFYVEHWSLLLDLVILIKTPFIVLRKTGAW